MSEYKTLIKSFVMICVFNAVDMVTSRTVPTEQHQHLVSQYTHYTACQHTLHHKQFFNILYSNVDLKSFFLT